MHCQSKARSHSGTGSATKEAFPLALSDFSEGGSEIVVVENQDHRKYLDCGLEVCDSAGKSSDQFFGRNVMSALGHAHGNAFLRSLGAGNADEAEHDVVAGGDRVREERKLFARRIGVHGSRHRRRRARSQRHQR